MKTDDTKQDKDNTLEAEGDSVETVVSFEGIPTTRKPIAGWRSFECCECEHNWREKTRDHKSPSGSNCPKCGEWEFPYTSNSDEAMKIDPFGNLS